jgi:hypothetical protein
MKASAVRVAAMSCLACLSVWACGESARTPVPAPPVTLTANDRHVWAKLPPDRSAIPVVLYHGLGPKADFSDAADADYGVDIGDFAKQMTMIKLTRSCSSTSDASTPATRST